MLDLDNTSVCEECVMMCTELQYEDADEDIVVYGDQGINTEEYEKAMYGCRILGLQPLIPFLQCVNWLGLRFVL